MQFFTFSESNHTTTTIVTDASTAYRVSPLSEKRQKKKRKDNTKIRIMLTIDTPERTTASPHTKTP